MESIKNLASDFFVNFRLSKESIKRDEIEKWEADFYADQLGITIETLGEIIDYILRTKRKIKKKSNVVKGNIKKEKISDINYHLSIKK